MLKCEELEEIQLELSIVVPIWNMENNLRNLFEWIPRLENSKSEVILVCNGCTDGTITQIQEFVAKYNLSNVELYEILQLGPGHARNFGLSKAKGEYVVFWDSDDVGDVGNLLGLLKGIDETDLVVGGFSIVRTNAYKQDCINTSNFEDNRMRLACNPGVWRCIFRTSFVRESSFGASMMGEDQVFLARVLSRGPAIDFSNTHLYDYYTQNPTQLTSNSKNLHGLITSVLEIAKVLSASPLENSDLLLILFLRLCLTGIKKGTPTMKIHMAGHIMKSLLLNMNFSLTRRSRIKILMRIVSGNRYAY